MAQGADLRWRFVRWPRQLGVDAASQLHAELFRRVFEGIEQTSRVGSGLGSSIAPPVGTRAVEMIADRHEVAGLQIIADAAGCIGDDEDGHPKFASQVREQ